MLKRKWMASVVLAVLLCCVFVSCALALQPIEITSTVDHGDGRVTITWNNPNGGTAIVGSLVNGNEEAGNRINIEQDISGNSYTYENLAPGLDYILLVMPDLALENAGFDEITVREPPKFDNFRLTLKNSCLMYAVFKDDGNYTYNYASDLSPQKIYDMLQDKLFLVRLDFSHSAISSSQTYPILTVVTSPTGYVMTDYREIQFTKDVIGFWQTTLCMNNDLLAMYENYGEIPTGRYDVKVYVDGEFVGETSFTI